MNWFSQDMVNESLEELSQRTLQEKLWLSDGSSDVSSFTEAVEQLFTDSGLADALEKGTANYSQDVEIAFRNLEQQLSKVDGKRPPSEIISDPAMEDIRAIAAEVLTMLKD